MKIRRKERRLQVKEEWKTEKRMGRTKLNFTEFWRKKLDNK